MAREEEKKARGVTRREFIQATAALGATVSTLGFPNVLRGAKPPEILIGHIHPLSGFLAFDGQELKNGLALAVKEINEAGGIKSLDGAQIKLIDSDSEGKPELAIREVERLHREGAVAITGCYQSSVTLVATQMAEKLRVPFMVSVAVADEITNRGFKYTFRVQPNSEQMASQTVRYVNELSKASGQTLKTIAYLHEDSAFGTSIADHVVKFAPQYGMEVVAKVAYSPKAADFSTEVGKIKAANADLVMDTGYFGDGVRILRTMKSLQLSAKGIIGCANGAFSHPKFVAELGDISEFVMDGNYKENPKSELTKKAFANYKALYGSDMGPSTVYAYAPMYVIADALERAKSTDRDALREALAKTNMVNHILPQGPIEFDANGQNKNASATLMQILKGKINVVWPEQYAEAKPLFPMPA